MIVGADWSQYAYRRGKLTDLHQSPVGEIPGVYLHANYAAALIDSRLYRSMGRWVAMGIEAVLVAFVAVLFAVRLSPRDRVLYLSGAALGLVVVAYLSWQNFGLFIEPIIPIILLVLHWLYDENRHMRAELQRLSKARTGACA